MASQKSAPSLPSPVLQWIDSTGRPTQIFIQFMTQFAKNPLGTFVSAPSDSAAASAGVELGQVYLQNGVPFARMK